MPEANPHETRVLDVCGDNITAATGNHLGKLFNDISAKPSQARENRASFVISFSKIGVLDIPLFAAPNVRAFCAALDRDCPHATYFLSHDPTICTIRTYLEGLVPVSQVGDRWQYTLQDYMRLNMVHAQRVSAFAKKIGDDADSALDGLALNLPPEALAGQPALKQRILYAMAPTVRAIAKDYDQLKFDPRGREIMNGVIGRAATLVGIEFNGKVDRTLLEKMIVRLPD